MSYGLAYTLPFKSVDEKDYVVEVEREGYSGNSKELKGQLSPFVVTIEADDFIYAQTRFSTATMSIFGGDYLQDLFSTDYRMHRVTLYENEKVVWCGFIKPEIYTQDFRNIKFELDLECMSAMSVLEYVDYKQQGSERGLISIWNILKRCIEESRGKYGYIYIPHVYALSSGGFTSWENPLEEMNVSEQNFFDEDDTPMKMLDVLKEVMKFLGWTCVDWNGDLYFVDVDNDSGEYYRYDMTLSTYTKVQAVTVSVQDIGFSGSDHSLDIVPGYNKATVRVSNYPVGDVLPDMAFDSMKRVGEYTVTHQQVPGISGKYEIYHRVLRPVTFDAYAYKYGSGLVELSLEDEKAMFTAGMTAMPEALYGCIPEKYDSYMIDEQGNPDITDYDFTDRFVIRDNPLYTSGNNIKMIRIKGATAAYTSDAFYIYSSIRFLTSLSPVGDENLKNWDFHFQLRIGSYYYHGKEDGSYKWDTNPDTDPDYPNNLMATYQSWEATTEDTSYMLSSWEIKTVGRSLNDGYPDAKGYVCRLPEDKVLVGEMEFTLFAPCISYEWNAPALTESRPIETYLEGFDFGMVKKESDEDTEDTDRIYENVVNENYINDLDEIEFKISSFHEGDGACYSKVLIGDNYLTDNLYCDIVGSNVRPEEFFIRRIVNHYSATKIKLNEVLKRKNINPITVLSDKYSVNKKYINDGGEIDYKYNKFVCTMMEI
ncbi:hypothetical protein [Phocaeicola barnesiae]|uniref:Uncharacterized protein n=1 Tax=Phocaeicola barnesiae TaxID=376804 RepID=A0AAW5N1S4_9BACT|nr:hypothetical protein [Phocaeicola barnesiae]MCR8874302.1 hypothetical protein [Phocaeicola barnesiae]